MIDPRDLFAPLSPAGHALLGRGLSQHLFTRGCTAVAKGQPVSGAYFVLDGALRVYTLTPAGKEATLYLLRPGETCVLALNSLFNNLLYPAWVEAEADTTVAVVSGRTYRALFDSEPFIRDVTVATLSTLVFRLMGELEQVHTLRLDQRLAAFLLLHASAEGDVRQTQQSLAGHIGTTREVIGRLMADFAARGLVRSRRGCIRLLDTAALAALKSSG